MRTLSLSLYTLLVVVACVAPDGGDDAPPPPTPPDPTPELFDPTGTWAMTFTWGAGNCGLTGTTPQQLLVTRSGDRFLVGTGSPNETTSGQVTRTASSADAAITVQNSDVYEDGGSTTAVITINARATSSGLTGSGSAMFAGGVACTHAYTLRGNILR